MFRFIILLYTLIAIALLATSYYTTKRAKTVSGDDHYLFTQTRILVDRYVAPKNATDAALDEAFADDDADHETGVEGKENPVRADRPGVMTVEEPLFVLGFLDVTGSFIILGGMALSTAVVIRSRRKKRLKFPSSGPQSTPI